MTEHDIAEKVKKEHRLHEQHKQEEKTRHNEKIEELRGEAGLQKLVDRAETLNELHGEAVKHAEEIDKNFKKALNSMTPTQRESIKEVITIRDGSVFRYGKSSELSLKTLLKDTHTTRHYNKPNKEYEYVDLLKEAIEDDQLDTFNTVWEKLQELQVDGGRYTKRWKKVKTVTKTPDNYSGDIELIGFNQQKPKKLYYTEDSTKSKQDFKNNDMGGYHSEAINVKTTDPETLAELVELKNEVTTLQDNLQDELEEIIERRKEIKSFVETKLSGLLVKAAI